MAHRRRNRWQKDHALLHQGRRCSIHEKKGRRGHPEGNEMAEEQRRGRHVPADLPHPQQQDTLQGPDEAEDIRPFALPMGELCPPGTVRGQNGGIK